MCGRCGRLLDQSDILDCLERIQEELNGILPKYHDARAKSRSREERSRDFCAVSDVEGVVSAVTFLISRGQQIDYVDRTVKDAVTSNSSCNCLAIGRLQFQELEDLMIASTSAWTDDDLLVNNCQNWAAQVLK